MRVHKQLELLLEIQDLRGQRAGLRKGNLREMESDLFEVKIDDAIARLAAKVTELEERLEPSTRRRYRQLTDKGLRAVVPVLSGICYGCFMAVPTAWASGDRNERIEICENCGRFLYHVD